MHLITLITKSNSESYLVRLVHLASRTARIVSGVNKALNSLFTRTVENDRESVDIGRAWYMSRLVQRLELLVRCFRSVRS